MLYFNQTPTCHNVLVLFLQVPVYDRARYASMPDDLVGVFSGHVGTEHCVREGTEAERGMVGRFMSHPILVF